MLPNPILSTPRFAGVRLTVSAPARQWMSPTGEIDWALHERAQASLLSLGFDTTWMGGCFLEDRRFAGDDATRAQDLMAALTQVPTDLYMAMRGGWGVARLFDRLHWEALAQSMVPVVGYSDVTALNLALLAQAHRTSWQGPTVRDLIDPDPMTLEGVEMILGRRPWRVAWESPATAPKAFACEGVLWGGNLSVLVSLLGTPYFPRIEGGILFIEDIGEAAYRIDRLLMQLYWAGVLGKQQAVLVGDCQGADRPVAWAGDLTLASVLAEARARTGIPFIEGLPFGHVHAKVSLPVGERVALRVSAGQVTLERAN